LDDMKGNKKKILFYGINITTRLLEILVDKMLSRCASI